MKKNILFLFIIFSFITNAQTNVSGGIYSNTTWTKANSPYIVTDTVVVFPGVTLTIEPGVVVKFNNNKYMEIRQANIIAEGTITDSITFTSNAASPVPGLYTFKLNNYPAPTVAKFNYCNFQYATRGLYAYGTDTLTIRNSNITYNTIGLYLLAANAWIDSCNISNNVNEGIRGGTLNRCTISHNQTGIIGGMIKNCIIEYNQIGVYGSSTLSSTIKYNQTGIGCDDAFNIINHCVVDSNTVAGINMNNTFNSEVLNCEIKYNNGIGIEDHGWDNKIIGCDIENNITGIKYSGADSIYCNTICNNTGYDFQYASTGNPNFANNYWCSTDSATIAAHIYDGYDNISLGLITFLPVDTVCAPGALTSVNEVANENSFHIYPNPSTNKFTISFSKPMSNASLKIFNMMGEEVYKQTVNGKLQTVNTKLSSGIYFVQVRDEERQWVEKIVVE